MNFAERYGPWAVIAGASEGTGRAFARQVAAQGVNCILIARREAPLTCLADDIRAESRVECVTAAIDLAAPDAFDRVVAATSEREIGLFISNAGADPNGAYFLDREFAIWMELAQRNVVTMMQCSHHFAQPMCARGKGGLLFVNSGACYGGSAFMAAYLRIPGHDGQDSGMMADTVPAPWRTVFRSDGGHFGGWNGMLSAMMSEHCPR